MEARKPEYVFEPFNSFSNLHFNLSRQLVVWFRKSWSSTLQLEGFSQGSRAE